MERAGKIFTDLSAKRHENIRLHSFPSHSQHFNIDVFGRIIKCQTHDLNPTDKAFLRYHNSNYYMSRVDHACYIILHGPLHIMSILANFVGLFAEGHSPSVTKTLRQEQED